MGAERFDEAFRSGTRLTRVAAVELALSRVGGDRRAAENGSDHGQDDGGSQRFAINSR